MQIVRKVLAKEPSGRYRTADQLGRILMSYRESSFQETGLQPVVRPIPKPIVNIINEIHEVEPVAVVAVAEQPTQVYALSEQPTQPPIPIPTLPIPASTNTAPSQTDMSIVTLGLVTLIALLGLIPIWYLALQAWRG